VGRRVFGLFWWCSLVDLVDVLAPLWGVGGVKARCWGSEASRLVAPLVLVLCGGVGAARLCWSWWLVWIGCLRGS
jgi:hypothetical protein